MLHGEKTVILAGEITSTVLLNNAKVGFKKNTLQGFLKISLRFEIISAANIEDYSIGINQMAYNVDKFFRPQRHFALWCLCFRTVHLFYLGVIPITPFFIYFNTCVGYIDGHYG